MRARMETRPLPPILATALLCVLSSAAALAEPVRIEAVLTPKVESKLEFADGSKRYLLATQREGKAAGSGPLAGANMLEWGVHDVDFATGADAGGYLVFTALDGDIAYLRYQFRANFVPAANGKRRLLANGTWETTGGTGKFKALRGAGTLNIKAPSPSERQWVLEGELLAAE